MRTHTQNQLTRSAQLEKYARQNRSWLTPSEALLWSALNARQLGVQFRRQVPLGSRFIVDFLAPSVGLIVEVDGVYHARRRSADACRDAKLRRLGFRVLRLDAESVLQDLPAAVARVHAAL